MKAGPSTWTSVASLLLAHLEQHDEDGQEQRPRTPRPDDRHGLRVRQGSPSRNDDHGLTARWSRTDDDRGRRTSRSDRHRCSHMAGHAEAGRFPTFSPPAGGADESIGLSSGARFARHRVTDALVEIDARSVGGYAGPLRAVELRFRTVSNMWSKSCSRGYTPRRPASRPDRRLSEPRSAGTVFAGRPGLVRELLRRADRGAGRGLGRDRQRTPHAHPRADRERQDAGCVPVDAGPAGQPAAAGADEGRPRRRPGPCTCQPAQGADLRRRAEPAGAAGGDRPGRCPPGRAGARHHGRQPDRRHAGRGPPQHRPPPAGHPDHDPRIALPDAHQPGPRGPPRRRARDRRRGPRDRRVKRGAHLALSLERLDRLVVQRDGSRAKAPQRIGLSATQRPLERSPRFLGGAGPDREVTIVDAGSAEGRSTSRWSSRSRT